MVVKEDNMYLKIVYLSEKDISKSYFARSNSFEVVNSTSAAI
jgi:hypothetical protein